MHYRHRLILWAAAVLVAGFCPPAGAQRRYTPPTATNGSSNRIPARRLLTLTFERTLQSEQKSVCSFTRPSPATTFDSQGFLIDVAANVPRYRTFDGNTGLLVEGPRTNYCVYSSFETGVGGWDTGSLTAADVLPEHAADAPQTFTAFDGIIFNRIFTEFWNDIETPRTPQSNAGAYSVATLAAAQKALAGKGVARNFIKAASFGNFARRPGWEGAYGLPVSWFNDSEWSFLLANVTKAADYGRRAGFAGFAVDIEYGNDLYWHEFYEDPNRPDRHDLRSRTEREQQAFARGQQLAQTILRAWPGAQLLFIPFETQYGPLYRHFFVGFVEGARRGNGAWVGIMNEYGYHADTRATAVGTYHTQNGQLEDWIWSIGGQRALSYWRIFGEHFNAAWPLGRYLTSDKRFAHRTPAMFAQQLELFREVNASTTVIYEEGDAWWQISDRQARSYGLVPGTELYRRNTAPTNPNLDAYLKAIPR